MFVNTALSLHIFESESLCHLNDIVWPVNVVLDDKIYKKYTSLVVDIYDLGTSALLRGPIDILFQCVERCIIIVSNS